MTAGLDKPPYKRGVRVSGASGRRAAHDSPYDESETYSYFASREP